MTKYLIILLLLSLPAVVNLSKPEFMVTQDADWMAIRLTAFHQTIRDGQFPVRWSARLNHGYGYPVFNFIYPLPFYIGEILYLATHSITTAINWFFLLSFVVSAITMFMWLSRHASKLASLAGAITYLYTPYRFVDTYVRGSIGESLGFVFVPLIFYSLDLVKTKPKVALLLGAFSLAATVLSHNVFVIFAGIGLVYGLISLPQNLWKMLGAMFGLSLLLSAYFWLPALVETKYVYLSQIQVTKVTDHLLNSRQLLLPSWGYEPIGTTTGSAMSLQLGIVNVTVAALALVLAWKKSLPKTALFFMMVFWITVLLIHRLSSPFWQVFPGSFFIQFPWRLLAVTTFASSFLVAMALKMWSKSWLAAVAILSTIVLTAPYAKPKATRLVADSWFATNEDTTTIWQEYMPIWVKQKFTERTGFRVNFIHGRGIVSDLRETNLGMSFRIEASEDAILELAIVYYPGWQAIINGKPTPIEYQDKGLITITISQGVSIVDIRWKETPLRQAANYVSLITLLAILSRLFCQACWQKPKRLSPAKTVTKLH